MENNNFKELVVTELLNDTYKKLEWVRDDFDFETKVDNYRISLISTKDSLCLVIDGIPYSADRHVCIGMENDKRVQDLYSKVFDFNNEKNQNKFLRGLYNVLRNKK